MSLELKRRIPGTAASGRVGPASSNHHSVSCLAMMFFFFHAQPSGPTTIGVVRRGLRDRLARCDSAITAAAIFFFFSP